MTAPDAVAFITVGDEVFAAGGDTIGTVADVQAGYFVVAGGLLFPAETAIPFSAITSAAPGRIILAASRDEALHRGWHTASEGVSIAAEAGYVARTGDDAIVIPLREEALIATTRPVAGSAVHITKRVVNVERGGDLPATDDRIRVERRTVERPGAAGEMRAFTQIIIEIPLNPEIVTGLEEGRLTEEIIVTRETVQRIEQVTGTVRREDITIDGELIAGDDGQDESAPFR